MLRKVSTGLPVLAALVLALGSTAGGASAQRPASGSETTIQTATNLPEAGGVSTSETYTIESEVGHAVGPEVTSSTGYSFAGGTAWTSGGLAPADEPVVWGVSNGFGDKDGGQPATVFGFNFAGLGAPSTQVAFGGVNGTGTVVVSNTVVATTTPAGVDALGNPKASVDIRLRNAFDESTARSAYLFTPALDFRDAPRTNFRFHMNHVGAPNSLYGIGFGQSTFPPFPIPPFDGQFEIFANFFHIVPLAFSPTGFEDFILPMPPDPIFVGFTAEFQLLSIENLTPLEGSFSNRLEATFVD